MSTYNYDTINQTKSIFSNISLEDIRCHYTLWSEEGQKRWFVYKCKKKENLEKFSKTFKVSSWIIMSPALNSQEGLANFNIMPFMSHMTIDAINRKIQIMKNKLLEQDINEDYSTIPLWYEVSQESIDDTVKEVNLKVSSKAIVNIIKNILEISEGNILSLINVVKDLNIESVFNFKKTNENKKKVKTSTDVDGVKVYVLFDYTQNVSNSKYLIKRFFRFSKKKIEITGTIFIFKPRNKAAREICKQLLHFKVENILQNARISY